MFEVREVCRLWLSGRGYRTIEALVRLDRKTIRRIVEVAVEAGLDRAGGDVQLDDVCQGPIVSARWWSVVLPVGGHRNCPGFSW